jgi:hypothetical protein
MNKLILIVLLIGSINIYGQPQKLILQIDTLEMVDYIEALYKFRIVVGNQGFIGLGDSFDSTRNFSNNKYPNYLNTLIIKSDSSNIQIPIDLYGSYIQLNNIHKVVHLDTLRIGKIELFDCRIADTSYITKKYFKQKKNGQDDYEDIAYKIDGKRQINNYKCKKEFPLSLGLYLNKKKYHIELRTVTNIGNEHSDGHGYKPRRKRNGKPRKNTSMFTVIVDTQRYIKYGQLDL